MIEFMPFMMNDKIYIAHTTYVILLEDKISVINAKQHLRAALKRAIISADVKFVQRKKESSQQQVWV